MGVHPLVHAPSIEEMRRISDLYGLEASRSDLEVFRRYIEGEMLASFAALDGMADERPAVRYPRDRGQRPPVEQNRHGAWAWRCSIKGATGGLLAGKSVALKDNISVAGVPMASGSAVLDGYVPQIDATIVTRILDEGAEIAGKSMCEDLSLTGGSHTSKPWPVLNPYDPKLMAGGSSSGSAVLLAIGEVDMAIGGDQGGSIRLPASWCGVYGLKPTWGLVPYTGILPLDMTIDHAGPMARTVEDIATLLEVIAGRDGLDPRQDMARTPSDLPGYSRFHDVDPGKLRIGILREGFGWPSSEEDVDETVLSAAARFRALGATVEDVSVPMHRQADSIFGALVWEGIWSTLRDGFTGHGWLGYYDTDVQRFFAEARRTRARELSPQAKVTLILGHYLSDRYRSGYYAKAQNLRRSARAAYDDALSRHDLLLMPTTSRKAMPFPSGKDTAAYLTSGEGMGPNLSQFDLTGHPALSVPCGLSHGLPVGMMLVGRHFDETTVLGAARCYERAENRGP